MSPTGEAGIGYEQHASPKGFWRFVLRLTLTMSATMLLGAAYAPGAVAVDNYFFGGFYIYNTQCCSHYTYGTKVSILTPGSQSYWNTDHLGCIAYEAYSDDGGPQFGGQGVSLRAGFYRCYTNFNLFGVAACGANVNQLSHFFATRPGPSSPYSCFVQGTPNLNTNYTYNVKSLTGYNDCSYYAYINGGSVGSAIFKDTGNLCSTFNMNAESFRESPNTCSNSPFAATGYFGQSVGWARWDGFSTWTTITSGNITEQCGWTDNGGRPPAWLTSNP